MTPANAIALATTAAQIRAAMIRVKAGAKVLVEVIEADGTRTLAAVVGAETRGELLILRVQEDA